MDNQELLIDNVKEMLQTEQKEVVDVVKDNQGEILRRDNDSVDDFEHLEHDISPVKEIGGDSVAKPASSVEIPPRVGVASDVINTSAESVSNIVQLTENTKSDFSNEKSLLDTMNTISEHLLDLDSGKTDKSNQDLLADFSFAPPVPKHAEDSGKNLYGDFDSFKTATQNFIDTESDLLTHPMKTSDADLADRFSDSEPEIDDFKQSSNEELKMSSKIDSLDDFLSTKNTDLNPESFKDVIEEPEVVPAVPEKDYLTEDIPAFKSQSEVTKNVSENIEIVEKVCVLPKTQSKQEVIGAEAMFCKMGLDAWFNPERLNPKVESLIYWRDPKKSGAVFGGTLVVLLSLAYFSFISVAAYLSLLTLVGTISFRIYKNVLQAVQKTGDGHPFKDFLEADVTLPKDKVREFTDVAITHINAAVVELRRLFLVEDLVDSIKFGVLLWGLTYLGAWFNGMTIVIIAFVALFTLPKIYENNKTQIDANLDIVRTKLAEITSKVKAAIPIGKKAEEKKEQ